MISFVWNGSRASAATNWPALWLTSFPLAVMPAASGPQHFLHGQYAVTSITIVCGTTVAAGGGGGGGGRLGGAAGAGRAAAGLPPSGCGWGWRWRETPPGAPAGLRFG